MKYFAWLSLIGVAYVLAALGARWWKGRPGLWLTWPIGGLLVFTVMYLPVWKRLAPDQTWPWVLMAVVPTLLSIVAIEIATWMKTATWVQGVIALLTWFISMAPLAMQATFAALRLDQQPPQ